MVFLNLALLLMITTMILLAAYLRRYQYEEYDIKLPKDLFESSAVVSDTWNYYRLNLFFRTHPSNSSIICFKNNSETKNLSYYYFRFKSL